MQLPVLGRGEELARLQRLVAARRRGVGVLRGRRRCGKSRLLLEALPVGGAVDRSWGVARPWWGPGTDRAPLAVDVVAESTGGAAFLVGEAERSPRSDLQRLRAEARDKVARLPSVRDREVLTAIWTLSGPGRGGHFGPRDILHALRQSAFFEEGVSSPASSRRNMLVARDGAREVHCGDRHTS